MMNAIVRSVALLGLLTHSACSPRTAVKGPGPEPAPLDSDAKVSYQKRITGRAVLLAEYCPQAAAGRPGIWPVALRRNVWTADEDELALPFASTSGQQQFGVLRWNGARAGVFTVVGTADSGAAREIAFGSYAGASPCEIPIPGNEETLSKTDAICVEVQNHCGLAAAVVDPKRGSGDEAFAAAEFTAGGACISDGRLVVDINGDGQNEAFRTASWLSDGLEPAEEIVGVGLPHNPCKPSFAQKSMLPMVNPRSFLGADLLGVLDLDGDGVMEIVVAFQYPNRRSWAIYSAVGNSTRLDLLVETSPWPRVGP